jgi:mannose-6-phosphate isomerase-like protein (cupin superfamily)
MNSIIPEQIEQTDSYEMHHFSKMINNIQVSDFNLIRFIVKPNKGSIEDKHKVREYWFICKGKGNLSINGMAPVPVKEGQLFFFDSMISHQIHNTSMNENLEILSVWW